MNCLNVILQRSLEMHVLTLFWVHQVLLSLSAYLVNNCSQEKFCIPIPSHSTSEIYQKMIEGIITC